MEVEWAIERGRERDFEQEGERRGERLGERRRVRAFPKSSSIEAILANKSLVLFFTLLRKTRMIPAPRITPISRRV